MKNKKTITVGIPAYNEAGNIAYLLESILRQKGKLFTIKEIIVISDGSIDKTNEIVQNYGKKYPFIKLVSRKKRSGKANALNDLYGRVKTDFLVQIDADLVFEKNNEIGKMLKEMVKNKNVNLVCPRFIPVKENILWSNLAYYSYEIFMGAALKLNNGHNTYTTMGAYLIRTSFLQSFRYPKGIIGDQTFIFASVIREGSEKYKFVKNAHVFFRPVATFADWRRLGLRSTSADKLTVSDNFSSEIVKTYYHMPKNLYIQSLLKHFVENPFYAVGVIFIEVFIRLFPLKNNGIVRAGMWETNMSSKVGIKSLLWKN